MDESNRSQEHFEAKLELELELHLKNRSEKDLYRELENDYLYLSKEVDFLAMEAINTSYVPIVSSRSNKSEMEASIRKCGKSKNSSSLSGRITSLAILTDQVVASAISPLLTNWEVTEKSLVRQLEILGKEWFLVFKDCSNHHYRVTKLYVENILFFLQRQYQTLLKSPNNNLDQRNLASVFLEQVNNRRGFCDQFFWYRNLTSIDGRENPSRKRKHSSSEEEMRGIEFQKKSLNVNYTLDTTTENAGHSNLQQKQTPSPFTKIKSCLPHERQTSDVSPKFQIKASSVNNNSSKPVQKNLKSLLPVKRDCLPVEEFFISNFQCFRPSMEIKCWVSVNK